MNRLSVRARITGLVVLVALVLGVVAATLGIAEVEDQLISDELDVAAAEQLQIVEDLTSFAIELEGFDDDDFDEFDEFDLEDGIAAIEVLADEGVLETELTNLAFALAELERSDLIEPLVGATGADVISILTYVGQVAVYDPSARAITGVVSLGDVGEPIVPQSVIDSLAFSAFEFDLDEAFDVEDEDSFEGLVEDAVEASADGLVFATRQLDGREYVVVADAADIFRSVDRIAGILWISVPILVVAGALVAWWLVGRALQPVHAITNRVGAISSGNLDQRVPEPDTGDEIAELAATMNSMLDRLEVDDRRLRQFVSDASHELRSPVAVLRSEAEVAKRSPDGTTVEELADGVLGESTRLQRIVEDLLVLARGEERQGAGRASELDVDDIVLHEAARRRRLPVDTHGVSAGRIHGTPEAVGRVVTHLLDNAARHGETLVRIGLRSDEGQVELTVDDDGPGVPTADRERIFERFARLDDARTRDRGGAGLGLAVVAESVRAMAGTVTVEDASIGGARFIVRWPAAD